jgi:hypothetical protein
MLDVGTDLKEISPSLNIIAVLKEISPSLNIIAVPHKEYQISIPFFITIKFLSAIYPQFQLKAFLGNMKGLPALSLSN